MFGLAASQGEGKQILIRLAHNDRLRFSCGELTISNLNHHADGVERIFYYIYTESNWNI